MLNDKENNYIAAVYLKRAGKNPSCSIAYSDVSTGEFCVTSFEGSDISSDLFNELVGISPRELIANSEMFEDELLLKRIKARFYTEQAEQRAFDIKRGTESYAGILVLQRCRDSAYAMTHRILPPPVLCSDILKILKRTH